MNTIPPEKFPDPFLYDTNALLADLDSIRELVLRIPLSKETFAPTNVVVAAIWELRDRLRFLVGLHAERQRDWRQRHAPKAQFPPKALVEKKPVRAFRKRQAGR